MEEFGRPGELLLEEPKGPPMNVTSACLPAVEPPATYILPTTPRSATANTAASFNSRAAVSQTCALGAVQTTEVLQQSLHRMQQNLLSSG